MSAQASKFTRRVTLAVDAGPGRYPKTLAIAIDEPDAERACVAALKIGRKAFGSRLVGVTTRGFGLLCSATPEIPDPYALARGSA